MGNALQAGQTPDILEEAVIPTMSDNRRRKIQARQRKAENAQKSAAKAAKRAQKATAKQAKAAR